jgi:hypothetical protein
MTPRFGSRLLFPKEERPLPAAGLVPVQRRQCGSPHGNSTFPSSGPSIGNTEQPVRSSPACTGVRRANVVCVRTCVRMCLRVCMCLPVRDLAAADTQFHMQFYQHYLARWPTFCVVSEAPGCRISGYSTSLAFCLCVRVRVAGTDERVVRSCAQPHARTGAQFFFPRYSNNQPMRQSWARRRARARTGTGT